MLFQWYRIFSNSFWNPFFRNLVLLEVIRSDPQTPKLVLLRLNVLKTREKLQQHIHQIAVSNATPNFALSADVFKTLIWPQSFGASKGLQHCKKKWLFSGGLQIWIFKKCVKGSQYNHFAFSGSSTNNFKVEEYEVSRVLHWRWSSKINKHYTIHP